MIRCMWQGPTRADDCNEAGTILLTAKCSNGCWGPRVYYACEEHSVKVKLDRENPDHGCAKCGKPVDIIRMTSAGING